METLFTIDDVSKYLKVCRKTVYNLMTRGILDYSKVCNKRRFTLEQIQRCINSNTINSTTKATPLYSTTASKLH